MKSEVMMLGVEVLSTRFFLDQQSPNTMFSLAKVELERPLCVDYRF